LRQRGAASVRCQVSSQGRLGQCVVVRQTSAGFGEAALRLTPLFRMRLSTADGQPVAGREITVPFHFGQDD
jgi:protein TonB